MRSWRLDGVDVAVGASTRLVSERRRFRDTVVRHRSGYLDAEELGVLFKNMRMPMGQRELDDIVDEIDVDGNGEIDFEEFLLVIKNMQNPGADSA